MNKINTTILLLGILILLGAGCDLLIEEETPLVDEGYDYIDIYTTEDFLNVAGGDMDAAYRLRADIDLTGEDPGFIGTTGAPFTGVFEGNHKTITALFLDRNSTANVGMFRRTQGSDTTAVKIQNLTLEGFEIRGKHTVGALVGLAEYTEIKNVHVLDSTVWTTVTGSGGWHVGQIAGAMRSGSITESSASGGTSSSSAEGVGGLVGALGEASKSTHISKSFSSVSVEGTFKVGGLVGTTIEPGSSFENKITDSYATGSVAATSIIQEIGGLVGFLEGYGKIEHSYATGSVTPAPGGGFTIGALVGKSEPNSSISNSYYQSGSGRSAVGVGSGSATELLPENITTGSFSGWDFSTVWQLNGTGTWPTLR